MAAIRKYEISLDPASKTQYGYEIKFCIGNPLPRTKVEASSFAELRAHAERIATEYGKGCHVGYRVIDGGRKPSGFDKFRNDRDNQYFNLTESD